MSIPYHVKVKINWYLWKSMINEINNEYKRKISYIDYDYVEGLIYGKTTPINYRNIGEGYFYNYDRSDFVIHNFRTNRVQVKNITYYAEKNCIYTPSNYIYSSGRKSKKGFE